MTTAIRPRMTGIESDPSRFSETLCANYDNIIDLSRARRELGATLSAIVGGRRRIDMRHNTEGRWAVCVDDDVISTTIILHWSAFTADEANPGRRRYTTRGEALCTLVHEAMHVLYTTETPWPTWVQPHHRDQFHMMLNFAEDVRIEDLGEAVVPAFRNLRAVENERLVKPNVASWPLSDLTRQVMSVLFCELSTITGSSAFRTHLRNNPNINHLITVCRDAFVFATQADDTDTVSQRLRPVYEAIAPYLDGTPPPPPPGGEGGEGGEGEGEGEGGEPDENESGEGGQHGTSRGTADDEADEDGDGEGEGDAEGDADEDGDESDETGDTDDDPEDRETEDRDTKYTTPGGPEEGFTPNAPRGMWEEIAERPEPEEGWRDDNRFMRGDPISYDDDLGGSENQSIDVLRSDVANLTGRIVKHMRRVLQDNANGGWSTRKRSGVFDPRSSTRIALGDMRTFRKRREAKGTMDYSLVLCLDASGSVKGPVGESIARAGLAMYDAASRIHGLDVAICAYGGSLMYGVPFDANLRDVHVDGSRNTNRLASLLVCAANGYGGGTHEAEALTWAAAVSRKRNAQAQMVVVLTDGAPSLRSQIPSLIEDMRADGIRTGGIGVMHEAPSYHEYAVRVDDIEQVPAILADLVRTMMKGR